VSVSIPLLAFLHQQQSDDNHKHTKTIDEFEMLFIGGDFQTFFPFSSSSSSLLLSWQELWF
jgi:hypothetical protein